MTVTEISVSFVEGRRYLSVSLDGVSAGRMEVPEEEHCAEIIGLLWPDLPLEDRAELARGGGVSGSPTIPCPPSR